MSQSLISDYFKSKLSTTTTTIQKSDRTNVNKNISMTSRIVNRNNNLRKDIKSARVKNYKLLEGESDLNVFPDSEECCVIIEPEECDSASSNINRSCKASNRSKSEDDFESCCDFIKGSQGEYPVSNLLKKKTGAKSRSKNSNSKSAKNRSSKSVKNCRFGKNSLSESTNHSDSQSSKNSVSKVAKKTDKNSRPKSATHISKTGKNFERRSIKEISSTIKNDSSKKPGVCIQLNLPKRNSENEQREQKYNNRFVGDKCKKNNLQKSFRNSAESNFGLDFLPEEVVDVNTAAGLNIQEVQPDDAFPPGAFLSTDFFDLNIFGEIKQNCSVHSEDLERNYSVYLSENGTKYSSARTRIIGQSRRVFTNNLVENNHIIPSESANESTPPNIKILKNVLIKSPNKVLGCETQSKDLCAFELRTGNLEQTDPELLLNNNKISQNFEVITIEDSTKSKTIGEKVWHESRKNTIPTSKTKNMSPASKNGSIDTNLKKSEEGRHNNISAPNNLFRAANSEMAQTDSENSNNETSPPGKSQLEKRSTSPDLPDETAKNYGEIHQGSSVKSTPVRKFKSIKITSSDFKELLTDNKRGPKNSNTYKIYKSQLDKISDSSSEDIIESTPVRRFKSIRIISDHLTRKSCSQCHSCPMRKNNRNAKRSDRSPREEANDSTPKKEPKVGTLKSSPTKKGLDRTENRPDPTESPKKKFNNPEKVHNLSSVAQKSQEALLKEQKSQLDAVGSSRKFRLVEDDARPGPSGLPSGFRKRRRRTISSSSTSSYTSNIGDTKERIGQRCKNASTQSKEPQSETDESELNPFESPTKKLKISKEAYDNDDRIGRTCKNSSTQRPASGNSRNESDPTMGPTKNPKIPKDTNDNKEGIGQSSKNASLEESEKEPASGNYRNGSGPNKGPTKNHKIPKGSKHNEERTVQSCKNASTQSNEEEPLSTPQENGSDPSKRPTKSVTVSKDVYDLCSSGSSRSSESSENEHETTVWSSSRPNENLSPKTPAKNAGSSLSKSDKNSTSDRSYKNASTQLCEKEILSENKNEAGQNFTPNIFKRKLNVSTQTYPDEGNAPSVKTSPNKRKAESENGNSPEKVARKERKNEDGTPKSPSKPQTSIKSPGKKQDEMKSRTKQLTISHFSLCIKKGKNPPTSSKKDEKTSKINNHEQSVIKEKKEVRYTQLSHNRVCENVRHIINWVFERSYFKILFIKAEMNLLQKLFELSDQKLTIICLRLYTRQEKWYNVVSLCRELNLDQDLNLTEISRQLSPSFVSTDYSKEKIETLMENLQAADLKDICSSFRLKPPLRKQAAINALLEHANKQCTLTSVKRTDQILRERINNKLGICVRLHANFKDLLYRIHLLYSFTNPDLETANDIYNLMNKIRSETIKLPDVAVDCDLIFADRYQFLQFAEACTLRKEYIEMCEQKNTHSQHLISLEAHKRFTAILEDEEQNNFDKNRPFFLRKFTAAWIYCKVLTSASQNLGKSYPEDVSKWLSDMLRQKNYCVYKRGKWYIQLTIVKTTHLKQNTDAVKCIIDGLSDKLVGEVSKHELSIRGSKFKRGKLEQILFDQLKYSLLPPCNSPIFRSIQANVVHGNEPGRKLMYVSRTSEGNEYSSVEETAIRHYTTRENFTKGIHCEGQLLTALFFILFWDILYTEHIKNTFITELQHFPLDLFSGEFYKNRSQKIDKRLKEIRDEFSYDEICRFVSIIFKNNTEELKTVINNWFGDDKQFHVFVRCIGKKLIAAVCERLAKDYRQFHSGLPDLFLWNHKELKCCFVEVKSEKDKLSTNQILWLNYLSKFGAKVEVCCVQNIGSKWKSSPKQNEG